MDWESPGSGVAPHLASPLIVTHPDKCRMPEMVVARPFGKRHIDDLGRLHPPQRGHLGRRYTLTPLTPLRTG